MSRQTKIEVPTTNILMISPRDYRLSSLNGTVVNFRRDVPCVVPPNAYAEAIECGAYVDDDQKTPDPAQTEKDRPSIEEAAKLSAEAFEDALNKALTKILTRNEPEDFKADGTPKVNKVIAEMSPEIRRPTATEIAATYEVLQENYELAED